jgi:uncharacterized membrane protein
MPLILFHIGAAVSALLLGAAVLLGRKGTLAHRWLGRAAAGLLLATALSSFGIASAGIPHLHGFGPIHLLSVLTIATVWRAVVAIRAGQVARHRRLMVFAYLGLVGAGLATLIPGRLIGSLAFG